jgi:hypothetical protein
MAFTLRLWAQNLALPSHIFSGTDRKAEHCIGRLRAQSSSASLVGRADDPAHAAADPRSAVAQQRRRRMSIRVLHVPERPSWKCQHCSTVWPCQPAKDDIIATTDRVNRIIYLSLHLADAIVDQPDAVPTDLFDRVVGWACSS